VFVLFKDRRPFFELDPHPTSEELEDLKKPAQKVALFMLTKFNLRGVW